jgi:hypothetical protein
MTAAPLPNPPELAWVEHIRSALDSPFDPDSLSDGQLRDVSRDVGRFRAMLDGRNVAIARTLERREAAKKSGFTSTGSLLAGGFGGNRAAGDRLVRTAKNLESATLTQTALDAGDISLEQAEVISRAVAGLPDDLDDHTKGRVEKKLIFDAQLLTLPDLRRRVMRIADLYADKQAADRDENDKLSHQEARAWAKTELWFGQARDGLVPVNAKVPVAQADILKASLDPVAAPRRNHLDPSTEELRYSQRLGRAFCAWIEHLPTDGFPTAGGTPAMVAVNTDLSDLEGRLEAAAPGTLSTGTRLSAGEVRRLACQFGVIPKVLGGQSVVLDQGRSQRLFTPAQRTALAERDHGCVYPGCDRPPGWCEAHHLDHWTRDNGPTTLTNGALLCAFHHREVHTKNYAMRLSPAPEESPPQAGGAPTVQIQINGIWETNHRWRP